MIFTNIFFLFSDYLHGYNSYQLHGGPNLHYVQGAFYESNQSKQHGTSVRRMKKNDVAESEKYDCCSCKRKYLRKKSLTRHLRYECGKDPQFICPVEHCLYKAYYRIVLEKHMLTHMKK